jgi:ribosome-associated protein
MVIKKKKRKTVSGSASRALARRIAKALSEHKGIDIVALDFRKRMSFTDFFIICTGTSDRHVQALADGIDKDLSKDKIFPLSREGYRLGRWILLDYGDVVAHIFHKTDRDHYRLEQLWHDIPRVIFKGVN